MAKDLYGVLGISRDASPDDIKKAYRKMSKEWHPDKHKGDKAAETKFKEINEAYEVLGNPERKKMFDQFGTTGNGQNGGGAGYGGFDFSNFSQGDMGGLGDMFESFFGGQRGGNKRDRTRGADREIRLTIDFMDTVTGARHTIRLEREVTCSVCEGKGGEKDSKTITCPTCQGTGQVTRMTQSFFGAIRSSSVCPQCMGSGTVPEKACRNCSGAGRVVEKSDVTIQIPPGIDEGQTLKVSGEGDAGLRGATPGDLFVHIRVRPDPRFEREGADIRSEISVSVVDAILGSDAEVQTVQGASTVRIPEGMQPGQTFRLKGKGMPILNTSRFGDHYVMVNVEIPKKLSRAERKIVEEWKSLER